MRSAFLADRVLLDDGFATQRAVLVDDGRITAIADLDDPRIGDYDRIDLSGRALLPGFIDTQVNGGGDVLFNDAPTVDTIARIGAAHARFGTTGFLPTLISDDLDVMRMAIAAVDAAIEQGVPGVLGIHLEGPFLAPDRKGIHDAAKFLVPDSASLDIASSLKRGRTLITLAPERTTPAAIAALTARGVIVAGGHSAATYAQTRAALDAGLRGFTHLYNAMSPLTGREPGMVGAALEDRDSWCGLIVDGFHAHAASFRVALAAKPRGKLFLVTDAMPPVGGKRETFTLGERTMYCRDGRCADANGTLAGSALDMATAVRNSAAWLGVSLEEAARMGATYAADFIDLTSTHGRISVGCAADFVAFDASDTMRETWIGGKPVFSS